MVVIAPVASCCSYSLLERECSRRAAVCASATAIQLLSWTCPRELLITGAEPFIIRSWMR